MSGEERCRWRSKENEENGKNKREKDERIIVG